MNKKYKLVTMNTIYRKTTIMIRSLHNKIPESHEKRIISNIRNWTGLLTIMALIKLNEQKIQNR
jgi:hypothetical protein